ncbi:recombinase family protein [uncultured Sphingomonas sp.]|uniref:recombinase family protein n=1 Tax=uncultured Sphingomonas sp. TaxID=158754 RepID=UPI0026133CCD|nr:recombinase family protein [uncultured Sphingomonas sp.]
MKTVRCAIYTRKSSDEGLEQSFNSLDAQREACGAYILSQASEGWSALPEIYDDGGLSGGTLERPALKRLLAEVAAGRVDIIVVYKVDRLTRSLFDFAKLVETFDAAGTSFVSVTQSFNTTTSMGRLTLNMLLSFAQFEREVTAERIRDKIAASKARGMWMGGTPPLGYAPNDRSLVIVEEHASLVRHLFARYLALGSVRRLMDELAQSAVTVPVRTTVSGKPLGGGAFTRGQLYQILKNVVYTGRIGHKDKAYPGLHPAIIDTATFDAVQAMLADHLQGHRSKASAAESSPLAGRIVDASGEPLVATHATKNKVRHRYYVSRALQQGTSASGLRIPAREIEALVAERVQQLVRQPLELATQAALDVQVHQVAELHARCEALDQQLAERRSPALLAILKQVQVDDAAVTLTCDTAALAKVLGMGQRADAPATIEISCAARLTRSGRALRLVQDNGATVQATPDRSLVRLLVQARRWWGMLRTGEISTTELAVREGVTSSYVSRVVRLAFLAPAVTEAILAGRQRAGVTVASLTAEGAIAADWQAQIAALLPARRR